MIKDDYYWLIRNHPRLVENQNSLRLRQWDTKKLFLKTRLIVKQ